MAPQIGRDFPFVRELSYNSPPVSAQWVIISQPLQNHDYAEVMGV